MEFAEHFPDPSVRKSIEVDLELLNFYDRLLGDLERYIEKSAKGHNVHSWYLLRSIPGVGKILSLILLYEIHDIRRFPRVQDFVSYCRLVKCPRESAGKKFGAKNTKVGNVHLKWAFCPPGRALFLHQGIRTSSALPQPPGQQTRQGKSPLYPRPQDRSGCILHAQKKGTLQHGYLLHPCITAWGGVCEPIK
jgi:Transposase IS116/IS110/IS902 family